jgi:hypothetical protein
MKITADLKQQLNQTLTKREAIAAQILAGLAASPSYIDKADLILVLDAIALTDLLLDKLGGK